jgi:hypothetical protein
MVKAGLHQLFIKLARADRADILFLSFLSFFPAFGQGI